MPRRRLRLLTIAGSDSGGGAGIQADLKTFAAHGAYGMTAITALTAQDTHEVWTVHEVPPAMVAAQIDAVLRDIGADAVKIGMLAGAETARIVAGRLRAYLASGVPAGAPPLPIVLDPVMLAKGGTPLLAGDAVAVMAGELLPLATLVTPNIPELERLTGLPAAGEEERRRAAEALAARGPAVLAKGGHAAAQAGEPVVDLLVAGGLCHRFAHPRLANRSTHGTGCTLSSAIAVRLAAGEDLPLAVGGAIAYLHGAIAAADPLGGGCGPVDHLYLMEGRDG